MLLGVATVLILVMIYNFTERRYLLGHWEEEQNSTHWFWYHTEEFWVQPVNIPKLPAWTQAQLT